MVLITTPHQSDVPRLTQLMNAQSPHAPYANYYYAMLATFLPDASVIAKDSQNNDVIGGFAGLYDMKFRTLMMSHIVSAMELPEDNILLQTKILRTAFNNAAKYGVENVSAHLDISKNLDVEKIIHQVASEKGLSATIAFASAEHRQTKMPDFGDNYDFSAVAREDIHYRHPTIDDAHTVWSIVSDIHRQAEENPEKSGLDVYALSNYERLFRGSPETCAVATYNDQVVGFATGFIMHHEGKNGLFLWQTGVHESFQGKGIGTRVERLIIDKIKPDYSMWTVEGSNGAANRTAEKKAEYMDMVYERPDAIGSEALGEHEAEQIYVTAPPENIKSLSDSIKLRLAK